MTRFSVYSIKQPMETSSYASRDDGKSLWYMMDIFTPKDGFKWFIEDRNTHLWLCKDGTWTKDPHRCLHFDIETHALVYSFDLSKEIRYSILFTEHEFMK